MTFQIAYNRSIGNAIVAIAPEIGPVPEDVTVETRNGDMPDLTKYQWNPSILDFEKIGHTRYITPTEFMRLFTLPERLSIRALERDGDLVVIDAMALMSGTKEGVNLDDPDVYATLMYLVNKTVLQPDRVGEILR